MKDFQKRCSMMPILKSRHTEWRPSQKLENGSMTMPYPIYEEDVFEFIEKIYQLELTDIKYRDNFILIKDKELDQLNIDEILTYLTYYVRGERFCDGLIARGLKEGTLEKLTTRLRKLSTDNAN